MIRQFWKFHGGIHPPQHKHLSTRQPIAKAEIAKHLILPLHQHIGESAEACVSVGEHVFKGQNIAHPQGYISAPVHASSSGTVVAIEDRPIPHPSGMSAPCVIIETDGEDRWIEHAPEAPYTEIESSHLRNLIRSAGIVGLGGAGFPSFIKLNPTGKTIDTLILNGVECEPYITCDDMLMREKSQDILAGAKIMQHALKAKQVLIAIEDNKPIAHEAMEAVVYNEADIDVVKVPTLYPQGSEKQLIKVLTGKECPSDGLPVQIGIVVHNVGTAAAVHRAINLGEPLISRVVTISGDGVKEPRNLEVPFGTPMQALIDQCGGATDDVDRIVMGGPMMGFAMHSTDIPVIKTTNCILASTKENVAPPSHVMPCIRCGSCASVCPVSLLPQQLHW
ncbi:electron transport complex subunit RsxC, partial [Pseudomonadota bacterium]